LFKCIDEKTQFNFEIANKYYTIANIYVTLKNDILKLSGVITDFRLLTKLSKAMLGPNSQFLNIKIFPIKDNHIYKIVLISNLINMVQKTNQLELNFIIKSIENKIQI